MPNNDSFQDLLARLKLVREVEQKQEEDLVTKTAEKFDTMHRDLRRRSVELDRFRYLLTLLLVTVKLGIFSYLDPNPLVDVSWIIVFLPAFFLEAIFGLLLGGVIVIGTIGIIGINGYRGLQKLAGHIRSRRTT